MGFGDLNDSLINDRTTEDFDADDCIDRSEEDVDRLIIPVE